MSEPRREADLSRSLMPIFRLLRIAFEAWRFGLAWTIERLSPWPPAVQSPEQLCRALARLGTTFIKFGQALSIRRDMLPDRYVAALQSLQEHIAPFPGKTRSGRSSTASGTRSKSCLPSSTLRRWPPPRSLRSTPRGSMTAERRSSKSAVQRSNPRSTRLKVLARAAMAIVPRLRHYQPLRLIDEIWTNLQREIDFRHEARNIRRFVAAFADWPTVHIPGVIDDLACQTVIVQERSAGRRIDDPAVGTDGPRLAQNFVEAYLHQIFVLGVFHGDPHLGNLFITGEGRICFHDFGLVGTLDRGTRRSLASRVYRRILASGSGLVSRRRDRSGRARRRDRPHRIPPRACRDHFRLRRTAAQRVVARRSLSAGDPARARAERLYTVRSRRAGSGALPCRECRAHPRSRVPAAGDTAGKGAGGSESGDGDGRIRRVRSTA